MRSTAAIRAVLLFVFCLLASCGPEVPEEFDVNVTLSGDFNVDLGINFPTWVAELICTLEEERAVELCEQTGGFLLPGLDQEDCPSFVGAVRTPVCRAYEEERQQEACVPNQERRCTCDTVNNESRPSGWDICDENNNWTGCDCPSEESVKP